MRHYLLNLKRYIKWTRKPQRSKVEVKLDYCRYCFRKSTCIAHHISYWVYKQIECLLRQTMKYVSNQVHMRIGRYHTHHVCLQCRHLDCTKAPNSLLSPLRVCNKCNRPSFSRQRLSQSYCDQFPPIEGGGDATPPLTKAKTKENKWNCEEQGTICDVKRDWGKLWEQVCVWPHGGAWGCPQSNAVLQWRWVIMQTIPDT